MIVKGKSVGHLTVNDVVVEVPPRFTHRGGAEERI